MTLDEALQLPRVAICGPANAGKSTLAAKVTDGRDVVHTDDFIHLGHEGLGDIIAGALHDKPAFVLEGVKAANALRAGLEVDVAIYLGELHEEPTRGQEIQAKGIRTVWDQWVAQDGGKTRILET